MCITAATGPNSLLLHVQRQSGPDRLKVEDAPQRALPTRHPAPDAQHVLCFTRCSGRAKAERMQEPAMVRQNRLCVNLTAREHPLGQ